MIQNNMVLRPKIFEQFKNVVCGLSMRYAEKPRPPYDFNMSLKIGDDAAAVKENRQKFFNMLGIDGRKVTFQFQVHSNIHNYVSETAFFRGSDGLYTDRKNLFLAVNVADCIPVFMYDSVNHIVAAIHSGWKGTHQKIVSLTLNTLTNKFGTNPQNVYVYVGPGISFKNFEVGKEVFDLFEDDFKEVREGKYFVDLKKDITVKLLNQGVKKENLQVSKYCSYADSDKFHSFRRDKEKSGRMLGIIGMR